MHFLFLLHFFLQLLHLPLAFLQTFFKFFLNFFICFLIDFKFVYFILFTGAGFLGTATTGLTGCAGFTGA
jgi:hypothetical protein